MQLSDSVSGCGFSCFTPTVCNNPDGEEDAGELDCPVQGDLPLCTDADVQCAPVITAAVQAIVNTGIASGGVEACSGDCIVNIIKATPAKKGANVGPFVFTATGPDVVTLFNITTNAKGIGSHTSKNLSILAQWCGPLTYSLPVIPRAGRQTRLVAKARSAPQPTRLAVRLLRVPLTSFWDLAAPKPGTWHVHRETKLVSSMTMADLTEKCSG